MASFATYPTLIPTFQAEWALSNTDAGWIGGVYFGGYVTAVGVLTALTDRVDPRRVYLAALVVAIVSSLGFALLAGGLWSASWWRFCQGVALAGTYMPGLKALTDVVPGRLQSRAVAFYTSSFGVGASLSIYASGAIAAVLDWRWAFILCSLGPLLSLLITARALRPRPPRLPHERPPTRLLDFRPVVRNRPALAFTLAYAAHNAELFGFRTWIVAFLVFSQTLQSAGALGAAWSAATIAAAINLLGMPSSILFNEVAQRFGRKPTLLAVMTSSALVAVALGFSGSGPFWCVLLLALVYGITVTGDSATITSGVVAVADARYRGTTMAFYSLIGFIGAFLGPIAFGAMLDLAGGSAQPVAWGVAFASIGAIVLLGPLAIIKLSRQSELPH